ncbi:hypothetical protein GO984_13450 [Rhodobacteraceae bacterium CY05]|uniref:Uncharacterized protein n=1 Tax=Parasedimentitalea huanghaiensis TaxID=2682100 RepID=A0A6L6WIP0_9RHOB|nr:hypothetical protein [Zongyanglinia huanghaiensis]
MDYLQAFFWILKFMVGYLEVVLFVLYEAISPTLEVTEGYSEVQLDFIANMTSFLAWPIVMLLLSFFFRKRIGKVASVKMGGERSNVVRRNAKCGQRNRSWV